MGWWIFGRRRSRAGELSAAQRDALRRLVADPLFELIPLTTALAKAEALPRGASVTVTASPTHGIESTFDLAEALQAEGHEATPHLSAHTVRDRAHLTELMDRARGAGFHKVFVVGGDAKDRGEFHEGLALLRAMDEIGHPFDDIGVPSYPEGHVSIPDDVLLRVLLEKQRFASSMTTQMSFNPRAVTAWIGRMRDAGVTLPLVLGTPGVADLTKLMVVSTKIGVADSARYLKKNRKLVGHLMTKGSFGPDAFLEALAPMLADPRANVVGLHLFTFNQVDQTVAWQQRMLEELGAQPVA
jgi:methylenetetrahydrofolate reductase (NADPH)